MSVPIDDDLRKGLGALLQVLEGVGELGRAATSAIEKADTIVGHMGDPETIGRVAAAGFGAVLDAANREVQVAATMPRTASTAGKPSNAAVPNVLACRTHGSRPWKGTIVCERCGRVFQVLDRNARRFASDDCPCGARLMPGAPGATFSAAPICSECFAGIAASGRRAVKVPRRGPRD